MPPYAKAPFLQVSPDSACLTPGLEYQVQDTEFRGLSGMGECLAISYSSLPIARPVQSLPSQGKGAVFLSRAGWRKLL